MAEYNACQKLNRQVFMKLCPPLLGGSTCSARRQGNENEPEALQKTADDGKLSISNDALLQQNIFSGDFSLKVREKTQQWHLYTAEWKNVVKQGNHKAVFHMEKNV